MGSLDALHARGLLGLTARAEDGGGGVGLRQAAMAVRAASRGCAATRLILAMHLTHLRASTSVEWPVHLRARVGRSAAGCGGLINALRVKADWAVRDDVSAAWSALMIAGSYTGIAEAARA